MLEEGRDMNAYLLTTERLKYPIAHVINEVHSKVPREGVTSPVTTMNLKNALHRQQ